MSAAIQNVPRLGVNSVRASGRAMCHADADFGEGASVVTKEEILTLAEVANDLQCSKSQISNLINGRVRGVCPLPIIPLGRRKLVRRSSLEAWKRVNERSLDGAMLPPSPQSDAA